MSGLRYYSDITGDMMMTVTEHDELMLTREYKMTIKEHLKLNGKELDIKYPIQLFDDNGNEIYFEDAYGEIIDNRPKIKELQTEIKALKNNLDTIRKNHDYL